MSLNPARRPPSAIHEVAWPGGGEAAGLIYHMVMRLVAVKQCHVHDLRSERLRPVLEQLHLFSHKVNLTD